MAEFAYSSVPQRIGKSAGGSVPKKAGREFVAADKGGKLPARKQAKGARAHGLINQA